jgi:hypothetical protein
MTSAASYDLSQRKKSKKECVHLPVGREERILYGTSTGVNLGERSMGHLKSN